MSMITSCPACGTMFRVVPDQLKISEGWVRCGHCAEVFDASANLSDESILFEPPLAEQATRPADLRATVPQELPTQPAPLPLRRAEPEPERPRAAAPDPSADGSSFFGPESQSLDPSPLDTPFVFRPSDLARQGSDSSVLPSTLEVDSEVPSDLDGDDDEPRHAMPNVSFVRQANRRAFWRRPMVRIFLAFASLLLAAVLLVQVAYQDRDRLAQSQPALQPWLARMCDALGCTLGAPRQIEAIVIESSGFNRVRNDTYRLAFTLRNTAGIQLAAPALELTITDGQDQTVARRVITPQEMGAPGGVIAAGGDWSRAVGLTVSAADNARVAGYRLLAFYP
ncbi:MAG: DUF3426 domain-containing protein [Comamonadaceae bacterium]|nr:MAG: DUF3426 domain-containing protein [Comamonadaceae bacterium]